MMEKPLESEKKMCRFERNAPREERLNLNAGFTRNVSGASAGAAPVATRP